MSSLRRFFVDDEAEAEPGASSDEEDEVDDIVAEPTSDTPPPNQDQADVPDQLSPSFPSPSPPSLPRNPTSSPGPGVVSSVVSISKRHCPDRSVYTFTEAYNADALEKFSRLKCVPMERAAVLRHTFNALLFNSHKEASYSPSNSATSRNGRLYGSPCSLQWLSKKERRLVLANSTEFDMVNAFPTLMSQYLKGKGVEVTMLEHYVDNRDEYLTSVMSECGWDRQQAKKSFLALMNDFRDQLRLPREAKTLQNFRARFASLRAQAKSVGAIPVDGNISNTYEKEERKVIDVLIRLFGKDKVRGLIHDAIVVDTSCVDANGGTPNALASHVKERTGYVVTFCETRLEPSDDDIEYIKGDKHINTTRQASDFIVEQFSDSFVYAAGPNPKVYYYDKVMNIWTDNPEYGKSIVWEMASHRMVSLGRFFEDVTKFDRVSNAIPLIVSGTVKPCINWEQICREKWRGVLPFTNGYIYFTEEGKCQFESGGASMGFTCTVPRAFDDSTIMEVEDFNRLANYVKNTLFQCFDKDIRDYVIMALARGIFFDSPRNAYFITGPTECGKGTITSAFRYAFGDLVGTMDAKAITCRRGKKMPENERCLGFMVPLRNCRVVFSNELDPDNEFDMTVFKQIISDGDEVSARLLYRNTTRVVSCFTPFFLSQEPPKFNANDEALFRRIKAAVCTRTSTDEEKFDPSLYFARDDSIKAKISTPEFSWGLIWLMVKTYSAFLRHGRVHLQPEAIVEATCDLVRDPKVTIREWASTTFEFTGDHNNDQVASSDLILLLPQGVRSVNAVSTFLKENGARKKSTCRGKNRRKWTGLKVVDPTHLEALRAAQRNREENARQGR